MAIEHFGLTIEDAVRRAYENSRRHAFWMDQDPFNQLVIAQKLALIHSEVSEALEAIREYSDESHNVLQFDESDKPVGFVSELADIVIRVCDLAGAMEIDLETAIREKMDYNETRESKHGKRF